MYTWPVLDHLPRSDCWGKEKPVLSPHLLSHIALRWSPRCSAGGTQSVQVVTVHWKHMLLNYGNETYCTEMPHCPLSKKGAVSAKVQCTVGILLFDVFILFDWPFFVLFFWSCKVSSLASTMYRWPFSFSLFSLQNVIRLFLYSEVNWPKNPFTNSQK